MRKTILISMIILFFASGCNKNKYNTVPSLKYKSVSSKELRNFQTIQFRFTFTDKEGDLTDSLYIIEKVPHCNYNGPVISFKLPSFPTTKNIGGDILFNMTHNDFPVQCFGNDTATFKFFIKDAAKHISDTATAETIIIYP